jgi:sigma-B regulation protein RsbU (phosphoserine phosphatase)
VARVGFGAPRQDDAMLRSAEGIVGHVIRSGETVLANDVARDPRYLVGRPQTRAELAVPIVSNGRVVGALNLEADQVGAFTAADAEVLEFFASVAALSIEKVVLHHERLEKQRMEHQLGLAREVQKGLLPAALPSLPGDDVAAVQLPTWTIGGDYYDYIPQPDGRLGLVIADVSGKGGRPR